MAFFSHPMLIAIFPLAGVLAEISLSAAPIDDFSTPQSAAVDATNDAVFSSTVEAGPIGGTVVPAGGQREIGVSKTNNAIGAAEAEVFPGAALYDALGAVMGRLFVEYSGLGGVDLSGFDKTDNLRADRHFRPPVAREQHWALPWRMIWLIRPTVASC